MIEVNVPPTTKNAVDAALRTLKKRIKEDGRLQRVRDREAFTPRSVRRREKSEANQRRIRSEKKRAKRDRKPFP